ncbi:LINE-1 reverse transcriptase like [Trifolium medium]|uniref:LINE-1 reverse transcriptase like n=1 Tax=Trifolium medium TaxID=97028 RepID=A0A392NAR3_9FABA|nr:LINE-1 reverse transcriptase like [Trifolium medium]
MQYFLRKNAKGAGGSTKLSEMTAFGDFIEKMELIDSSVLFWERNSLWFKPDGSARSRIDRLKGVIRKLISTCQTAFVPGRQILDGVVVVNELIDLAKRRRDKALLLKVDFEKAYDSVNWKYLNFVLRKMKFPTKWMEWMKACIFTSSMSILVNGSPTEDFVVGKGLRQGDPLSPFLFLLAAEGLTRLTHKAVEIGTFKGFKVSEELKYDILQFADDTILIGEGSWDNLWSIKTILRSFEMVSGLKVNFFKSKLYGLNMEVFLAKDLHLLS